MNRKEELQALERGKDAPPEECEEWRALTNLLATTGNSQEESEDQDYAI